MITKIKNNRKLLRNVFIAALILCSLMMIFGLSIEGEVSSAYASELYTVTYDANGGGTFSDGSTQNVVTYEGSPVYEKRISKTLNVSDDGSSFSGNYPAASSE